MFTTDQKYFSDLENDGLNHKIGRPKKPVTAKSSTKIKNLERRICAMGLGFASAFFSDVELEVSMCLTTPPDLPILANALANFSRLSLTGLMKIAYSS